MMSPERQLITQRQHHKQKSIDLPYTFDHSANVFQPDSQGQSRIFPRKGNGLGPGGNFHLEIPFMALFKTSNKLVLTINAMAAENA
jgi:hypothetical protein